MSGTAAGLRIGVAGAAGRMGKALVRALDSRADAVLAAALTRKASPLVGHDAGALAEAACRGVALGGAAAPFLAAVDVAIDVSTGGTRQLARAARRGGPGLVVGSSGLDARAEAELARAADVIAVVRVPNGSLGVSVLGLLAARAAATLGPGYDIEIVDMHHRRKIDAPSGTAIALGEAVARTIGRPLADLSEPSRAARPGRGSGSVGFAALRGGDEAVEHAVMFLGDGETVALKHASIGREVFANGLIRAACWLHGRAPGLYSMANVLGLG